MKHIRIAYRKIRLCTVALVYCAVPMLAHAGNGSDHDAHGSIELTPLGTYATNVFDDGAAEIVAYDPESERLFVVNGADATIDVLEINQQGEPALLFQIDVTVHDGDGNPEVDAKANSVAVHNGLVAAAVENVNTQLPGAVLFFDSDGTFLKRVVVGDLSMGTDSALPDMITFSPNGDWVLVANEGEPSDDYLIDPEGSVSIIGLSDGTDPEDRVAEVTVNNVDFRTIDAGSLDDSIRIFGPGATVAQDLEPEYIAVSDDSSTAWVVLQENNAVATIDIEYATVTSLSGLGFKDHSDGTNTLDASNEDGNINLTPWPVNGMYQPDSIVSYEVDGQTFLITANEGDARDYGGFSEEARVGDLDIMLDPTAFPNAAMLQMPENLGRLKITNTIGDDDDDGDYDRLFSYGARSFSIWSTGPDGQVAMVFDSGDMLEQITAAHFPDDFNSTDNENGSFDDRSDDKGPEPEGLAVGEVGGRTYAFVGLERIGGIVVFDVSDPYEPSLVQYINTRDFSVVAGKGSGGDLAPEGLAFISAEDSPTGEPLLAVAFEVSGTTTIFGINQVAAEQDYGRILCNSARTGIFGGVTAIPGEPCVLSGATVFGNVRAVDESTLFIFGGVVYGNVVADPGSSVAVQSSFVAGNIRCDGAEAPSGCQISRAAVFGNVRSDRAADGFVNVFGNDVFGNVRMSNSVVPSFVSLNTIFENLKCLGNSPAPNPGGLPPTNVVYGDKEYQCDESLGF